MKKLIALALCVCAGYAAQAQKSAQNHTGHVAETPKQVLPKVTTVPLPVKQQPTAPAKQTPAPAPAAPAKWKKN